MKVLTNVPNNQKELGLKDRNFFRVTSWQQVAIFFIVIMLIIFLFDIVDIVFGTDTDAFLGSIYDKLFGK